MYSIVPQVSSSGTSDASNKSIASSSGDRGGHSGGHGGPAGGPHSQHVMRQQNFGVSGLGDRGGHKSAASAAL